MINQDLIREEYIKKTSKSQEMFKKACEYIRPPGASHSARLDLKPHTIFPVKAQGKKIWDMDKNEYIDYFMGHAALYLGHNNREIMQKVENVSCELGSHPGTTLESEYQLAKKICEMIPSAELVSFVTGGAEANMYAIRIARGYTKKRKILKFQGHFHGHTDQLWKGLKPPYDVPQTSGIPEEMQYETIIFPFNQIDPIRKYLMQNDDVAAVIMEVVTGAGGAIPADKQYLKTLREVTDKKNVLLIFDEVITGFRLARGGAQEYYDITPDITTLGKLVGGGFPGSGAITGKHDIMEMLNPEGKERTEYVSKGGTYAGNIITTSAGLAALDIIQRSQGDMNNVTNNIWNRFRIEMNQILREMKVNAQFTGLGPLLNIHFTNKEILGPSDLISADKLMQEILGLWLINRGIYLVPTHNFYPSYEHTQMDANELMNLIQKFMREL